MTHHSSRCRRCWPAWALTTLAWFAVLEQRGYRGRCQHKTLSRELRELLGRRGCWLFAILGAVFSWHLLVLAEPEDSYVDA